MSNTAITNPQKKPKPRKSRKVNVGKQTKFRQLWDQRNTDRNDFRKRTGFPNPTVSDLLNGRLNFTLRILSRICSYYNCTPNDVIDYETWIKK